MSSKNKSRLRIDLEYYPVLLGVKLTNIIPLSWAFFISKCVFFGYFHTNKRHRERAVAHLLHAGMAKTPEEARKMAKANFLECSKIAVEILMFDRMINPENAKERVKVVGDPEVVRRCLSEPGILVSAHLGNWELAGIAYTLLSGIPLLSVMRQMSNPRLQELFYRRAKHTDHDSCDKKGAIKAMLKALRNNRSIAITADQHASTSEGVETMFFGHPASTHVSPALLHLKTGRPIFSIVLRRMDTPFHYELRVPGMVEVKPSDNPAEDIKKVAQMYTDLTEQLVRETPLQWLWVHRRWLDLNRKPR